MNTKKINTAKQPRHLRIAGLLLAVALAVFMVLVLGVRDVLVIAAVVAIGYVARLLLRHVPWFLLGLWLWPVDSNR